MDEQIPKGKKLVIVQRPDGEEGRCIEDDPTAGAEALASPRSVAEGKADAATLAAALGVTEAEATRRALAVAVEQMGGK